MAGFPLLPQPQELGRCGFGRGQLVGRPTAGLLAEHEQQGLQAVGRGVGLPALRVLFVPLRLQEVEILLIGHRPAKPAEKLLEGLLKVFARCRLVRIDGLQQPLRILAETQGFPPDALDPIGKAGRLLKPLVQLHGLGHDFVDGNRRGVGGQAQRLDGSGPVGPPFGQIGLGLHGPGFGLGRGL